jgi:Histidine phosphatase superfamily (branch 1)
MRSIQWRWWLNLGVVVLMVACNVPTPPIISQPGTTTTIIMVRHAERDPGMDPPLNAEGQARAQSLANMLGENGVTAIYTVDYIRNKQTVQPLADKLGLTPAIVDVTQLADTKTLAKVLVNEWLTTRVAWCCGSGTSVRRRWARTVHWRTSTASWVAREPHRTVTRI